ncbi:mycofactocin-coupled SDR family oxidoreductase [Streptomyces canus]|uniref:mycofactocin-coupled SDR family oxidoreductase n=1 Tax=Streptomyces canus TaxID=58343 RepID=UPI0036B039AE
MGRVEDKVAFITGAARGQGRSHAVRLAEEGADIVAIDLCRDYETVNYPMATPEDLKETARLVEKLGRKVLPIQADVRSIDAMRDAVDRTVAEFGKIDIVVAQAGIAPLQGTPPLQAWSDAVDVDLVGSINAIQAALPHLREGASVIATASTAALMEHGIVDNPGSNPGGAGYAYAKRALAEYMHELARNLAPLKQRANVVHPTNVNTQMLQSEPMYKSFRPDLEHPTRQDAEPSFVVQQAMPIPYVEPVDISNAVLFLASDEARYITGVQLRVDAGGYLKWHDWRR